MPSKGILLYEERVDLAAERYQNESNQTIRQLAQEFNVGREAIRGRVNGIQGKTAQIQQIALLTISRRIPYFTGYISSIIMDFHLTR
jgi:Zn-dependent peptidase ImmA (M78 family)